MQPVTMLRTHRTGFLLLFSCASGGIGGKSDPRDNFSDQHVPRDGPLRDGPLRDGPLRDGPLRDGPLP